MIDKLQIVVCSNPECSLRFSIIPNRNCPEVCPRCGVELIPGTSYPSSPAFQAALPPGSVIIDVLLDNIRSSFNVGSIFRSADGVGIRRIHLCGLTPTPAQVGVAKTALGADQAIPWVYHTNALDAAEFLKNSGSDLWALEGGNEAVPLISILGEASRISKPIVLVIGNEISGVDPGILALCDLRIAIPMYGVKDSLNVSVAFGIAAYFIRSARELTRTSPTSS